MSDEQQLSDRFSWEPGDIKSSPSQWDKWFVGADGARYQVVEYDDLIAYMLQQPGSEHKNQKELLDEFVKTLDSSQVAIMPDRLRDDLLDSGYVLP